MAHTNQQMLDLFDAAITNRFTADLVEQYSEQAINNVKMMSADQLLKWREYYAEKVAVETGATGAPAFFLAEPFDE